MAIPAPRPETERRDAAFMRMRTLFERLRNTSAQVDTLSMGMSGDFAQVTAASTTLVRRGTALFGARAARGAIHHAQPSAGMPRAPGLPTSSVAPPDS